MLFELRDAAADVSAPWASARDAFLAGRTREAWDLAAALRVEKTLATANDYVLNMEIARGCSAHPLYAALARLAIRRFPSDPIVQLYHARMLLTKGRYYRGIEYLKSLEPTLGRERPGLWAATLANLYGEAGFEPSCHKWLAVAGGYADSQQPLALYTQSGAFEGMRKWNAAIALAEKCVAAAPNWSRVRAYLGNCLLGRGRIADARAQFEEISRRGLEEATSEFTQAMLAMSVGDFAASRLELEKLLARWPQADFMPWVRRTLCILLFELGDFAAAAEIAQGKERELGLPPLPRQASGKRRFIPLPLLMQNKDQCVPSSVAMAAFAQGRSFDPETLFREMEGREGTAMWKMRRWTQQQGLRVAPIRLEKEAIVAMLDGGAALIGVLEGLFNNHVDVICGYNDDLQTLYVRDPMSWAPIAWPWEMGLSRYTLHGGVLAIFDERNGELSQIAETWRSDACEALLDLEEAVEKGDLAGADAAYARIGDDAPAAFVRDLLGINTAISPKTFQARLRQYADDEKVEPLARVRSIMALDPEEGSAAIGRLLEADQKPTYGRQIAKLLHLNRCMAQGNWREALELVDDLIERGGGVARFWEMKSDILAELGDQQGASEALEKAIELLPLRVSLLQKRLSRTATRLTYTDFLRRIDSLLASNPGDRQLLWARADALRDGPDGLEFERAAKKAISLYPRDPSIYAQLLSWYGYQGRGDLEAELLKIAKERMPDVFDEPPTAIAVAPAESQNLAAVPLPTDKASLMNVIWNQDDPRREAAIDRLFALEREGQLHWYESARLLACWLLFLQADASSKIAPASLLPDHPPGAAPWYAGVLCEVLTSQPLGAPLAQAVGDWLKKLVDLPSFPNLWLHYVILLESALHVEEAIGELQKIVDRYPAYASALYRLGVVKRRQGDLKLAKIYFERSLEADAGLYGAQKLLMNLHDQLNDPAGALHYARMLRKKLPYSLGCVSEEVDRLLASQSFHSALTALEEAAPHFPAHRIGVVRAQLFFNADQPPQAEDILRNIPFDSQTAEDGFFEDYLRLKLDLARKRQDEEVMLECCELGLGRWPDSTPLLELKAECLARSRPEESRELLRTALLKGTPGASTIAKYRGVLKGDAQEETRKLVTSAAPHRREQLAGLIADSFGSPEEAAARREFLTWAVEGQPHSIDLRWRLAWAYFNEQMERDAVREARELLRRAPDDPSVHGLLGRFLFEKFPKEAIGYLDTACRHDRSTNNLFDLARCRQLVGDIEGSRQIHWEILEIDPSRMSSWTNLYLLARTHFSQDLLKLWQRLLPGLEGGHGVYDEYFHVSAVKIALQLKKVLPKNWAQGAVARYLDLRTIKGFADEKPLLTQALLAWRERHYWDIPDSCGIPKRWTNWFEARFRWPGLRWIPRK